MQSVRRLLAVACSDVHTQQGSARRRPFWRTSSAAFRLIPVSHLSRHDAVADGVFFCSSSANWLCLALAFATASQAGLGWNARCQQFSADDQLPDLPVGCARHAGVSRWLDKQLFTEVFWREVYQKTDCIVRHTQGHDDALGARLTEGDVGTLVARAAAAPEAACLKVFRNSEQQKEGDPFLHYLQGSSLVVNTADRFHPVLAQLCRELTQKYFFHTFCVAYMTPAHSQAVRAHNDCQDVIIAQLHGSKRWRLYKSSAALIYPEEMLGKAAPIARKLPVAQEFTLQPGDVLYMPRGLIHEACAQSEASCHVTVTIPSGELNYGVAATELLREALSSFPAGSVGGFLRRSATRIDAYGTDAELKLALHRLVDTVSRDDVLRHFEESCVLQNQEQANETRRLLSLPALGISDATRLKLAHGIRVHVKAFGGQVTVEGCHDEAAGRRLELPRAAGQMMRALAAASESGLAFRELPLGGDRFAGVCLVLALWQRGVLDVEPGDPH
eukprot:TRINITY_DN51530_c0_g1_i1.p1 TRINITY_DN51530_c0_g1~~TRINITY_DN51530_c0_g1_i1.p1  ORF type:complete len:501 (-),score=69.47 TRINITY_DN51530_c0_g1_i1:419-1921(-)